jgi:hypothetical protein
MCIWIDEWWFLGLCSCKTQTQRNISIIHWELHHNKDQKKVIKVKCGFWCCQFLFVVLLSSTYWWITCINLSYYAKYQIRDSRLTTSSSWICKLLSFGPMFIWKRLNLYLILLFGYDIDHIARTKKEPSLCKHQDLYNLELLA